MVQSDGDNSGSDDAIDDIQDKEPTTLGFVDRNMFAYFQAKLGISAPLEDAERLLRIFKFQSGKVTKHFVNLVTDKEEVIDAVAFQTIFHAMFPCYLDDQNYAVQRDMNASRCLIFFKRRQ